MRSMVWPENPSRRALLQWYTVTKAMKFVLGTADAGEVGALTAPCSSRTRSPSELRRPTPRETRTSSGARRAGLVAVAGVLASTGAAAANHDVAPAGRSLDELIQRLDPTPGAAPEDDVRLDAWIERGGEAHEVVVVIEPQGKTKLVADPGITVTAAERPGLVWLTPLPHRHVDPTRDYFDPPTAIHLPFNGSDSLPIDLEVEYAYCVIDFQCFFGEATVTAEGPID